jgi:predicted Zn-dependent protease with MMP-like domain
MNRRVFERYVQEAVQSLPPRFRDALDNIEIVIQDFPDPEVFEDSDLEPPLLGLYQGVPLTERGLGDVTLPDKISIYMGEFQRAGYRGQELVEEIRLTIFHEIGHYFGLDDDTLEELES